jgi:hypothetical protein
MKVFNCRSPYIIQAGNFIATATKIELTIWRVGYIEPTVVTKTLEKLPYSNTQYYNYYNISPFVYDAISTFNSESSACNVHYVTYYNNGTTWVEELNDYLVGVNGYNAYDVYNYTNDTFCAVLSNWGDTFNASGIDFNYYYNANTIPTIDFIIDFPLEVLDVAVTYTSTVLVSGTPQTDIQTITYENGDYDRVEKFRIPMVVAPIISGELIKTVFTIDEISPTLPRSEVYECTLYPNCEIKYNPFTLDFINRLGGKQQITLFKNSTQTIEVKGSEYNTNTFNGKWVTPYDQDNGQKRIFNKNGNKTIKCNTGWIKEIENINIQDIFLSENLFLKSADGEIESAVVLKNSSQQFKTHLNDKVINYELEFEVASSLINNVV